MHAAYACCVGSLEEVRIAARCRALRRESMSEWNGQMAGPEGRLEVSVSQLPSTKLGFRLKVQACHEIRLRSAGEHQLQDVPRPSLVPERLCCAAARDE